MVQHLSIRVPWHDNGWNGYVCKNPAHNHACRALKNIAIQKDDQVEQNCANCKIAQDGKCTPLCIMESGIFMSEHEVYSTKKHPYAAYPLYKHIRETLIRIEPYSFVGIPYKWMIKNDTSGNSPNNSYFTQFDNKLEIDVGNGN
jgi:hypothetical protein